MKLKSARKNSTAAAAAKSPWVFFLSARIERSDGSVAVT
jgi:hypothetical protein